MRELYDLKEKLMDELKEYGSKEMSAGSLEVVDKLTHTIKNLCKIIEAYEEENEYSEMDGNMRGGNMRGGSYRDGNMYRGDRSYRVSGTYARGRGRNARRDSMGRYSSNYYNASEEVTEKLQELMEEAPDEKTRMEIQNFMQKLEKM